MNRSLGYVISLIGILIVVLGIKPVNESFNLAFLEGVSGNVLLVIGIVIAAIGVFILRSSPGRIKQSKEVPIFHGKEVVGFRRMGKKR